MSPRQINRAGDTEGMSGHESEVEVKACQADRVPSNWPFQKL